MKEKILASVHNEEGEGASVVGREYIEVALHAFEGREVGHITIDLEDAGTQYIIKWYPRGMDDSDARYRDPIILAEGHIEEGDIQRLIK